MAARKETKAAKAAPQDTAEQKAPASPPPTQQSPRLPPPDDKAAQQDGSETPPEGLTVDYVEVPGFTLDKAGDVVDAAGLALPPVLLGEDNAVMMLQTLAVACVAAVATPPAAPESLDAAPAPAEGVTPALRDVLAERARQVADKGYTPERDDTYSSYELPRAAAGYVMNASGIPRHRALMFWPFDPAAFKPKGYRADLVRAAALLLAEVERIDRAEEVTS